MAFVLRMPSTKAPSNIQCNPHKTCEKIIYYSIIIIIIYVSGYLFIYLFTFKDPSQESSFLKDVGFSDEEEKKASAVFVLLHVFSSESET